MYGSKKCSTNIGMNRKQRRAKKGKRVASKTQDPSVFPHSFRNPVLEPLYQKAMRHVEAEEYIEAADILTDIIRKDPTHFAAMEQLGLAFLSMKKYDAALSFFETLCTADPKNIKRYQGYIGCVYVSTDRYEEAMPILEEVSKIFSVPDIHMDLAVSYMYMGKKNKAKENYLKAVELAPDDPRCFLKYVSNAAKIESKDDPDFVRLKSIEEKASQLDNEMRALLYNTLFRVYDRFKEHECAMGYACLGAKAKRATVDYTTKGFEYECDVIKKTFKKKFIDSYILDESESPSVKPVFVVAMPRSGTTLLEQILGSHPDVKTIGEDSHIHDFFTGFSLKKSEDGDDVSFSVRNRKDKLLPLQKVAQDYLAYIEDKAPGAERIVEKGMNNFLILGYIRLTYPNVKFLHIKRNAMDSCLSMFTHHFVKNAQAYSYDMNELAHRYRGYVDMMKYWNELFPDHILNISYEDLTDRTEDLVHEILEFLDLPWDDQCLSFYKNKSVVKTASLSQVRKPIYKSSVGRWKRYGDKVQPLLEALGDCA